MTVDDLRVRQALDVLDALRRIGDDLLGKASRNAPLDEGTLRGSAELAFIVNRSRYAGPGAYPAARQAVASLARRGQLRKVDVEVAFTTIYAARQHEELDWSHPRGGRAKYLEAPLQSNAGRYQRILAQAARRSLG